MNTLYHQAIIEEIVEMAEALDTKAIKELISELEGLRERSELSRLAGLVSSLKESVESA